MRSCPIVRTPAELRARLAAIRAGGDRVGLVPTMGALHAGHLSLIALARSRSDFIVASIFVNPTQFAPGEDFQAYPRDEAGDVRQLASAGCDLVYSPEAAAMYPAGFSTTVSVAGVSAPLEGAFRPQHFTGVATVVAKLLIQAAPDIAVFGEKDYQQLQVIRTLARDLDLDVEILGAPIVRDVDGLALSSRNAYLTTAERQVASMLHQSLANAAAALSRGARIAEAEAEAVEVLAGAGFDPIDYLEVRDPETLDRLGPGPLPGPARILAAARLGRARLIDNLAV
ncbi:MAG TPA: pantoate--beta-alanine ligase [Caulobacteraceae bacterium]|jgi:pantoate--beta-alanine ligase